MLEGLSLYWGILCNFHKLLRNTISGPWFYMYNVFVSHKMGLATCFVSLSSISDRGVE